MKVICIIGLIGSGKNEVSDYIVKKYGYNLIDSGDTVREAATSIGRTHNRYDLQETQKVFRGKYGQDYFSREVVRKIRKSGWDKVIITGFRVPEDFNVPRKEFRDDMIVVSIVADEKTRFDRLRKRGSPRDPKTFEEFNEHKEREFRFFPHLKEILSKANYKIDNSGTFEDLHKNIDKFVKEHNLQ